jgi:mRNA interferase MazF
MIKNSIVLVQFPFDDFSSSKIRPAICLTTEIGKYEHVIIAFITSKMPDDLVESDLIIKNGSENSIGTGLLVDSVIRLHKIVTVPKSLIKRKLGSINKFLEVEVERKIKELFNY